MTVVVHDANVLIDLITADVLEPWCRLNFKMMTTSLVWREVNRKSQKPKLRKFAGKGMFHVEPVGAVVLSELVSMEHKLSRKLSLEDVSVLYLAAINNAILLTSEGPLKNRRINRRWKCTGCSGSLKRLFRGAHLISVKQPTD